LLFAAARGKSIGDACLRLRDAPCGQTIFNALAAWLPIHAIVERRLNAALAAKLPGTLRKRRQRLAIDLTGIVPLPSSVRSPSQASFRGTSARKPVGRTSPQRWPVLIRRSVAGFWRRLT
jgi:hypothetical protein